MQRKTVIAVNDFRKGNRFFLKRKICLSVLLLFSIYILVWLICLEDVVLPNSISPPFMQISFKTRLYVGFALAILLSAISGFTSYHIFRKQAIERLWVKRARYALDSANSIQHLIVEMETGRRGFRATNQQRFLEPSAAALPRVAPAMSGLKDLLSDDPEQEARAVIIESHIQDLMTFWKNNGDDADKYTRDYVTQLTDEEKQKVDTIRKMLSGLGKDENKLLVKRRAEYDALIHDSVLSSGVGSILCEVIIVILIIFIFREFKKRRQVQEQLNDSLKEVENINKQLEKFVHTVAHDIKSPLAGISGSLSILQADKAIIANPELAEFVDLSAQRAIHLSEMINSILEYSRVSAKYQNAEIVNTKEFVLQIAGFMFPPANIKITVASDMPVFKTIKIKILEVFQNLISNAIKYNNKKDGLIEIGCVDKADFYEFYVKDNGQGILPEHRHKVFELFNTGTGKAIRETSTGFGLNIVKLIVEEQGGRIWVDSVPGEGSTFYFEWKK